MSNVTIDINILTAALTQAIKAAVEASTPKVEIPNKKKKGRPAKKTETLSSDNVEVLSIDNVDEIIKEAEAPIREKPKNPNIFAAKRIVNSGLETSQAKVDVKKRPGEIKFIEINTVGDRISPDKYPEPTERRQAVEKMSFECDRCGRNFEAYPSEVPQAFMKEKITGIAEGRPRVICERCIGL